MMTRREDVTRAALEVFTAGGIHAVTHRAVDRHAGLPEGSTSNVFRTRAALIEALGRAITETRLEDGGVHDERLSLAWLELLVVARRDPSVAEAIACRRDEMVALLGRRRTDSIELSDADLAALLTGLEFASTVVGRNIDQVISLLQNRQPGQRPPGPPAP